MPTMARAASSEAKPPAKPLAAVAALQPRTPKTIRLRRLLLSASEPNGMPMTE